MEGDERVCKVGGGQPGAVSQEGGLDVVWLESIEGEDTVPLAQNSGACV